MKKSQITMAQKFKLANFLQHNKDSLNEKPLSFVQDQVTKNLGFKVTTHSVRRVNQEAGIGLSFRSERTGNNPVAYLSRRVRRLESVVDNLCVQLGVDASSLLKDEDSDQ